MTLGLTNGTNTTGLLAGATGVGYALAPNGTAGNPVNNTSSGLGGLQGLWGVTSDATKSGIIADISSLTLVCNMIIKF